MLADLKYALRSLRQSPGFTLVAILTLALCLGANCAVFSLINGVLVKPFPWPGSERLVAIEDSWPKDGLPRANSSIPGYLDRRAGMPCLEESALITSTALNLGLSGNPDRVTGFKVTPSFFSLLQTQPFLGRAFREEDAEPGATKTVILGYDLWRSAFAGDPALIGRTIQLDGAAWFVVGIMPCGFFYPNPPGPQILLPFAFTTQQRANPSEYGNEFSGMLGRLKPGISLERARSDLGMALRVMAARFPDYPRMVAATGFHGLVTPFHELKVQNLRSLLWLIQAGVIATLLIGCANVANLLLIRANARRPELAMRVALGAGRWRIIRQLLTESLVLFFLGGLAGLGVAQGGVIALRLLGIGRGFAIALDLKVFGFALGCTLLSGLLFGAIPAIAATQGGVFSGLKEVSSRSSGSKKALLSGQLLVVLEIAAGLMLVATTGLLVRSFQRVSEIRPGFSADRLLTARLSLPVTKYRTPDQLARFQNELIRRLTALPAVESVGLTSVLPFSSQNSMGSYDLVGRPRTPEVSSPNGYLRLISAGYLETMGIPLMAGRRFTPADRLGAPRTVIVDQLMVARYFPHQNPLGQELSVDFLGGRKFTIIGVVGTIKSGSLEESVVKETLYLPLAEEPAKDFSLVVRTSIAPLALSAAMRKCVLNLDAELPIGELRTMDNRIDDSMQNRRSQLILLSVFGGLALLLAVIGVYGVLAFLVSRRTQEIGIRMALGADRLRILSLILSQGATLVALGLLCGLGGYFIASRWVAGELYGVAADDPVSLAGASLILALAALGACVLPAYRATQVSPLIALKGK